MQECARWVSVPIHDPLSSFTNIWIILDSTQAVARGDLSQKVQVKVQGADLIELKEDINGMVEKLTTFAQEVTRVSLDVGTKGKLGGQAVVEGVEGTWQELTAVVNKLAENLTTQVRVGGDVKEKHFMSIE